MYPKYFKETQNAATCFSVIKQFETQKAFTRVSVSLSQNDSRFYHKLSSEFQFEVFSPHSADMNSSNNCSLVCKVKELSTGSTYLITGDTENDRWDSIVYYFGDNLASDVLAAPHHGSKNGISNSTLAKIRPKEVLISAGVNNQYGHPDSESTNLFSRYTNRYYSTSYGGGQSIQTAITTHRVSSTKFTA